jgi:hypothetical protein
LPFEGKLEWFIFITVEMSAQGRLQRTASNPTSTVCWRMELTFARAARESQGGLNPYRLQRKSGDTALPA